MNIKEIRSLNIIFSKDGYTKINLPKKWVSEMGKTKDNRTVKVSFDGERIIIE